MGRTDTKEYADWAEGFNGGIDNCIDIVKKSRIRPKLLKERIIKKMEEEKD